MLGKNIVSVKLAILQDIVFRETLHIRFKILSCPFCPLLGVKIFWLNMKTFLFLLMLYTSIEQRVNTTKYASIY